MQRNRQSADCATVLKRANVLFYVGLITLVAAWGILVAEKDLPGYLFFGICILGAAGVAAVLGGLIYAAVRLRCPKCGQSLMLGGRLPLQLPNHCPKCGQRL